MQMVLIVGRSDAGKTTLIERLIPALNALKVKVGTIKHDVHGFEIDHPGKDSYRHKHAGAAASIISSPQQMALIQDSDHDRTLDELAPYMTEMDLVLTEGYKRERGKPKVEIFRSEAHPEPLCQNDPDLIAMVSDEVVNLGVPRFGSTDVDRLARFLKDRFIGD
jgi:molybdopterin-guanine dinucleotide biosynthesis protein B